MVIVGAENPYKDSRDKKFDSDEIDSKMRDDYDDGQNIVRVLLVGGPKTGKTSLTRQFEISYGTGMIYY